MKKHLMLFVLLTLAAAPLRAIELSLEENKGEKGTIGFVDMDRVFREYPETKRAKEEFEAEVNNKRLEIKRRKSEIADLKSQLADLQIEREKTLRESLTEPAVIPAPAPAAPASTPVAPGVLQNLPGLGPGSAPMPSPSTGTFDTAAPAQSTGSTTATQTAIPGLPLPAMAPAAPPTAPAPEKPSAAQRVRDLEDKITAKQREVEDKEKAYKEFEAKSEADLIELEKHRVQLLLGKLYEVVQEVAKEEGVSVVVDKKAILFGQKAVDLTDKLLEKVK